MKCPHCNGTGTLAPESLTVGAMVLAARRAKGWTQQELSEACGLGRSQIANIEVDRSDIPVKTLRRLAEALGVRAGDLLP